MPGHKSRKPYGGGRTDRPSAVFLNTTGRQTLGVGVCSRCNFKFPLEMLSDDPNIPNFKVCRADRDDFDPYRMPARSPDRLTLPFVRPDVELEAPTPPDWEE